MSHTISEGEESHEDEPQKDERQESCETQTSVETTEMRSSGDKWASKREICGRSKREYENK